MVTSLSSKDITWNVISEPAAEELAAFVRNTNLDPVDAEFVARDNQRPEVTVRQHYLLLLIHVPVFDKKLRVTSGAALYFLITDRNELYTLSHAPIVSLEKILLDFTNNPEKQEEYFEDTALSLALHVIGQLHASSFRKVDRLNKHVEIAEDAVFHGNERKMVEEVALLTRDVLDFRKIVRPQLTLFTMDVPKEWFNEAAAIQWQRLASQVNQLWEILQSLYDSTKELRDTNDSLLQYKENELLRLLSIYSILAIPLWIFTSPFIPRNKGDDLAGEFIFWAVLGSLTLILLAIFLRAKRRKVL